MIKDNWVDEEKLVRGWERMEKTGWERTEETERLMIPGVRGGWRLGENGRGCERE